MARPAITLKIRGAWSIEKVSPSALGEPLGVRRSIVAGCGKTLICLQA
jgi:hypothetical protein